MLSTAYKVISNVNRSGKVTKELMEESGKKLCDEMDNSVFSSQEGTRDQGWSQTIAFEA